MAAFFTLLSQRNHPVEAIFAATDVAEENRVREATAAVKIQSIARMRKAYLGYQYARKCIIDIQRIYRGYKGRVRFARVLIDAELVRTRRILNYFATTIQSAFRGFYSRKWFSNFYAQKRYLLEVHVKSEAVRQEAAAENTRLSHQIQDDQRSATYAEYVRSTANMHHLLSTAARSGILRPALAMKGLATVFGSDIEEDIRKVPIPKRKFKADLPVSTCSPTVRGGSRIPEVALNGASLNASSFYSEPSEHALLESKVNRRLINVLHTTDFVAKKPNDPKFPRSLASSSEYVDQYTLNRQRRR